MQAHTAEIIIHHICNGDDPQYRGFFSPHDLQELYQTEVEPFEQPYEH